MTTSRDKDIFSQISGISTAVRNFAMRTMDGHSKRGSTCDPLGQEDSLFMGHLIGQAATTTTEQLNHRSIDESIDSESRIVPHTAN